MKYIYIKKNCINSKLTLFPPFFHSSTWEKVKKKNFLKKNEMKYKKILFFHQIIDFSLYISPPDVIVLVAIRT
jgi:hypothetical protein